ncbi:MFS transporter [Chloroflexota bacterium]
MVRKERFYYGWIVVAVCFMVGALAIGTRLSFGVFFSPLEAEFGWTRAMTSSVFSVYQVFCGIFTIFGGWAFDRYGPRITVGIMGSLAGLSLLLTSQVTAVWQLYISYSLLLGMGTGPTYAIIMGLSQRWFTKRRGFALGIVSCGAGVGTMIITPVSAYLIDAYGWQSSYFIMGIVVLLVMLPCAWLVRRAPSELAYGLGNGGISEAVDIKKTRAGGFSVLEAIKSRRFWIILLIMTLWSSCQFVVLVHLVRYAIDLGISSIQAATVISFSSGVSIFSRLAMGRISDSIGRGRAAIISALVLAGAMLWLMRATDLWMLYVFAILFGFSFGTVSPIIAALIGDVFGLSHIGTMLGILDIGWSVGAAIGPALAGYLFDINGNYVYAFLVKAIVMLMVPGLVLILKIPKRGSMALSANQPNG